MRIICRWQGLVLFSLCIALAGSGCSHRPAPPKRPQIDPATASQQALELYDANHDGKVDAQELKKAPALAAMLPTADSNRDGALSAEEIANRVKAWLEAGTALIGSPIAVSLDNKPLDKALVTFEPDKWLGPAYHTSTGTTNGSGMVSLRGPDPQHVGLNLGAYLVRVSKVVNGKETLPARYNAQTELGREIAPDVPDPGAMLELPLKRK